MRAENCVVNEKAPTVNTVVVIYGEMYVKSIIIDGFKSYGQRTEINGFDPLFNAITGLNGSGKSNILDSICFLLGITNLSQVRASNLQELVYKNGQAGITKATVSIIFDNRNKNQSPISYQQHDEITVTRQVVVGGRNKYLINGCNAQNSRVQDLFQSVQLNVNNPHFLIMQGRITKVLNMKPPEILSMIEEAAGTKMYESKKTHAQKTIEKKDAKLKEIETIIAEEITPTLAKLKEERASYLEFQKVQRELEHLTKLYYAYQFVVSQDTVQKSKEELIRLQNLIKTLEKNITDAETEVKNLDKVIRELQKKRDEESGSVLGELEDELKNCQKHEVKSGSNLKNNKDNLKAEEKKLKDLQKNMDEDLCTLKSKEKEMDKFSANAKKFQEANEKDSAALAAAQKHFQAVSAGLSSNADGEEATLADQLMAARSEIATAETNEKQALMKLKHAEGELKKKQPELKKTESSYKQDEAAYKVVENNMKKLQAEMQKLNYTEGQEEDLNSRRRTLTREIAHLQDKVDKIQARYPYLSFDYKDPEKNFDRSKVHGLVCNLFDMKEDKYATALEVSSGGKLFNVIVDTEITAKKLLKNGQLKRRYTIIPLNKIMSRTISTDVAQRAEKLVGKNNVSTALSLVNFNKNLQPAMDYVLGNTFVCPDMDTAKAVAFEKKIEKRTVTLEGDLFDPSGTLSGGSRPQSSAILLIVKELNELKKQLQQKQDELNGIDHQMVKIHQIADRYFQIKQQFDTKHHEAELLKEKLQQSTHHLQLEEIQAFQNMIDEQNAIIKQGKETMKKASEKVRSLEDKIKNAKAYRERELKTAEEAIANCKKKIEKSSKEFKEKQQEIDCLRLEIEDLQKGQNNYATQISDSEESVEKLKKQLEELKETFNAAKEATAKAQSEVQKQKQLLKEKDKEISELCKKQEDLKKQTNDDALKITQTEHEVSKLKTTSKEAATQVERLAAKYEWIVDEKKYFGQPNTAYDFKATDPIEAGHRLQKLQETKEKLAKNVNMRAMNMLGKAEEQYNDLMKKKKTVENDKAKLEAVMKGLDEKKNEALKKAWEQINKDFGSIFSTLLPGTQAKLVPPAGKTVLDGLEVKIAFGNVWKESLNELSGGQRSLVALSLILSMLLFKPAPIYILDEVDAALDLSHTQNIGQMLRTHFRHSQESNLLPLQDMFCGDDVTEVLQQVSEKDRLQFLTHVKMYFTETCQYILLKGNLEGSGILHFRCLHPCNRTSAESFIVVSLKDGMFNNANVLFKTKFVDGMSTVTRIEQHSV